MKRGRGFSYVDAGGAPIRDPEEILRIKELAIPPAWQEVWICPDPLGHLQATGADAAGRKQYLYHPRWRELRDRKKFEHMVAFANALPRLRRAVLSDLSGEELDAKRVLACAVRLLDVGLLRIGSEQYADDDGGLGLATVSKQHVAIQDGEVVFDYPAKGGIRRVQAVRDPRSREVVHELKRRRSGGDQLLAYRQGRRWHPVRSEQISDYLKARIGGRGGAPLLHRPADLRSIPVRLDDRRCTGSDRIARRSRRPQTLCAGEGSARIAARRS